MITEKMQSIIEEIPRISVDSMKLLNMISREDISTDQLVKAVETDGMLTARLLQIVNSPVYGVVEPVLTVSRAITFLGRQMISCIVMEECMGDMLRKPLPGYQCEEGQLWKHDLRTAVASKEIAKLNPDKFHPDVAFTSGLLHDVGKVVLSKMLDDQQQRMNLDTSKPFIENEEIYTEINHAAIGREIAMLWELPGPFREVIEHHHKPSVAGEEFRSLVYMVHLGDIIAVLGGYGTGLDNLYYQLDQEYAKSLHIDEEQIEQVMLNVEEEYTLLVSALG